MPETEEATREELNGTLAELAAIRDHLRAIHDSQPVSPREDVMLLGEEDPDLPTAVRSTIECILHDRIEPAIRDLRDLAAYRAKTVRTA